MRPHRPLRDLGFLDRARATVLLRGDDTEAIVQALVAITLHEPDGAWVETECHRLSSHPDPGVRRMCALGLGHVARVHRALDRGRPRRR